MGWDWGNPLGSIAQTIGIGGFLGNPFGINEAIKHVQDVHRDAVNHAVTVAKDNLTKVMQPLELLLQGNLSLGEALDRSSKASMALDPINDALAHEIALKTGQSSDDVLHGMRNIALVIVAVVAIVYTGGAALGAVSGSGITASGVGAAVSAASTAYSLYAKVQADKEQKAADAAALAEAERINAETAKKQEEAAKKAAEEAAKGGAKGDGVGALLGAGALALLQFL